jgi:hypothetical protein
MLRMASSEVKRVKALDKVIGAKNILCLLLLASLCGCGAGLRYGLVTQPGHKGYGQLELTLVDIKFGSVIDAIVSSGH